MFNTAHCASALSQAEYADREYEAQRAEATVHEAEVQQLQMVSCSGRRAAEDALRACGGDLLRAVERLTR